jgi:hypothetical protein
VKWSRAADFAASRRFHQQALAFDAILAALSSRWLSGSRALCVGGLALALSAIAGAALADGRPIAVDGNELIDVVAEAVRAARNTPAVIDRLVALRVGV